MSVDENEGGHHVRYEPDEKAPHLLAAGMAIQTVILVLTGIMITPLVIARGAGLSGPDTSWLVFAALLAAGVSTWLQLLRKGRIGGGYTLFVGSNVAFAGVAVAALQGGGIAELGVLGAVGALGTFAFTRWLPLLRKVLTPAVGGTVLMLMALSVGPVIWKMLGRPGTATELTGGHGVVFLTTLLTIVLILIFTTGMARLWATLLGVLVGSAVAAILGHVDYGPVLTAPWIGLPSRSWPGLSISLDAQFLSLVPAFILISLVACMETYADAISVQRIAYRKPRPIDFRSVQGAINADGVGSMFAGLLGTVPNTVFSTSIAVGEITGVASRRVGAWGGLFLILIAFSPKIAAAVAAIPSQVAGAYVLILVVLIFGHGVRLVTEDGMGFETGLAVCLSFWVGFSAQSGGLMNELLPSWLQTVFSNGTTIGGLTAIALMMVIFWRKGAQNKAVVPLDPRSIAILRDRVKGFATRIGWDEKAENRLMLAVEEAVLFLCEERESQNRGEAARGRLMVRLADVKGEVEIEMVTAPSERNAEELMARLPDAEPQKIEENLSLRLLSRTVKTLKHLQFHQGDYLLMRVDSTG
jgi:NCS2 family nucleobase:cation symporter-2/xanthine permease XanP